MPAEKKSESPKAMDISKPGSSPPDNTSRPVITTHKMIQDPMVKDASSDTPVEDKKVGTITKAKTLEPLTKQEETSVDDGSADTDSVKEADTPEEKPEEKNPASGEELAQEEAIVDAVVDQATNRGKDAGNQDVEDVEQKKHISELIDKKTYYLPIGQVTKRRNNRRAMIVLVLLLLVVAGYVAAIATGRVASPTALVVNQATDTEDQATELAAPAPKPLGIYNSPGSKQTFTYPGDWTVQLPGEGDPEQVSLISPESETTEVSYAVVYHVSPDSAEDEDQATSTVLDVIYTEHDLSTEANKLYLKELIFQNSTGEVYSRLYLTNDNTQTAGSNITTLGDSFITKDGLTIQFSVAVVEESKPEERTKESSVALRETSRYKEAKTILLSLSSSE